MIVILETDIGFLGPPILSLVPNFGILTDHGLVQGHLRAQERIVPWDPGLDFYRFVVSFALSLRRVPGLNLHVWGFKKQMMGEVWITKAKFHRCLYSTRCTLDV